MKLHAVKDNAGSSLITELTKSSLDIISEFKKGPEGEMYAVVRIYQKFKGYDSEGRIIYEDETTKDITVKLTQIVISTDIGTETHLQVLLGDINVVDTK